MKRIAMLLMCVLLSLSFCSCAIEPIADSAPYQNGAAQPASPVPDAPADVRQVLCQTEDFTVTVISTMYYTSEKSCALSLQYENSSDKALDFFCDYVSVNGWESSSSWFSTVNPGDRYTETIELDSYSMNGHEIDSMDKVSFLLMVCDSEDYYADPLLDESFTLYPTGLTDEQIVVAERRHIPGETVILDNDDMEFVVMEVRENSSLGTEILCYVENKTDYYLDFMWENTAVNGWALTSFFYRTAAPHSRFYSCTVLDPEFLELCGIEQIDKLTFDILVYSTFDLDSGIYVNESFCVLPTGLSPEDVPLPERTPVAGEQVIMDNAGVTVILEPLCTRDGKIFMNLYVRNDTDDVINVTLDNFTANGSAGISLFSYETVPAECQLYFPLTFYEYTIEDDISIKDVESIQCRLEVTDSSFTETLFCEQVSSSF